MLNDITLELNVARELKVLKKDAEGKAAFATVLAIHHQFIQDEDVALPMVCKFNVRTAGYAEKP